MQNQNFKLTGLSTAEVNSRISQGKVNTNSNLKTKSIGRIFYDNICTLFNLINIILFVALLLVGSYKNMLFIGVVVCNTIIGIVQEIRSKHSVDKLTILSESKVEVLRDGKIIQISKEEIVLDDIIIMSRGNQIPADCVVADGSCKVNESLLTGESNLIEKAEGDTLLSGSFISAGKCYARVTAVGADCYASKINNEAKYIKKVNSQILKSFKFIIKICTIIIFPLGAIFFFRQYFLNMSVAENLSQTASTLIGTIPVGVVEAVQRTVASLVGMIPSGMILLTSTVLAVSVIRLSRQKVLVNEMYCIESLARVDTLCVDKTGTLTADKMNVADTIYFDSNENEVKTALASIVSSSEEINATLLAIKDYVGDVSSLKSVVFAPFSSETKWSGGSFSNGKTYIIGAAEFVFKDRERYAEVFRSISDISQTVRIIAVAESTSDFNGKDLPSDLVPMALVLIKDQLRENVGDTINYFKEQGVTLKVISGDSVKTVQNIALDTGIQGAENAVDMSTVETDEQLYEVAERCNVFGRVTPAQKKKLVVALKSHGHSVAMMGDGVNDVLALKEADCSVAMASGSEAARNVSQLVLVNDDFASMPKVVAEGRRTINNVERSSSLYLVKTIYSILLSIFFIFFSARYPFEPIQLTLIGALTIGFPSFVLALQPNKDRVSGNFTFNIISRATPAALCVVANIIVLSTVGANLSILPQEISTVAVYLTALCCLLLIIRLSIPFNVLRGAMLGLSVAGLVLSSLFLSNLFSLVTLSLNGIILLLIAGVVTAIVFNLMYTIAEKLVQNNKKLKKNQYDK